MTACSSCSTKMAQDSEVTSRELFNQARVYANADNPLALDLYRHAAFLGFADALFSLGWIREAAERGHVVAMRIIGNQYETGVYVARTLVEKPNEALANMWYQRAADRGSTNAMCRTCDKDMEKLRLLVNNEGLNGPEREPQLAEAQRLFEEAHACEEGDGCEAFQLYQQAAAQGSAEAMFRLGLWNCFLSSEAAMWFQKAAERGHSIAMRYLGDWHRYTSGTVGINQAAIYWYERAALLGNTTAMRELAILRNDTSWYQRAADRGDPQAMVVIGEMCLETQDKKKAVTLFQKAAGLGHTDAMLRLAQLYLEATDGLRNTRRAVRLLRRASELGNYKAMYKLSNVLIRGVVVVKDARQTRKWLQLAVAFGAPLPAEWAFDHLMGGTDL